MTRIIMKSIKQIPLNWSDRSLNYGMTRELSLRNVKIIIYILSPFGREVWGKTQVIFLDRVATEFSFLFAFLNIRSSEMDFFFLVIIIYFYSPSSH